MCADVVLEHNVLNENTELNIFKIDFHEIYINLKSRVKPCLDSIIYGIGAFTYLNEGWNGWVYSCLTLSPIFSTAPYSFIAIGGGLLLGVLYANIFTAFNWKEFISGGLGVKNKNTKNKKALELLDRYNKMLENLDNNISLEQINLYLEQIEELENISKSNKILKDSYFKKILRYSIGILTGVMYCLAAYFTTSQAVDLLGLGASSLVFMPIFICCSLAEGLGFVLMENNSLMKYMKLGVWVDVNKQHEKIKQVLYLEKYKQECEGVYGIYNADFEDRLEKQESELLFKNDLDSLFDKVINFSDSLSKEKYNNLNIGCSESSYFNYIKKIFKKNMKPLLYLLLGSGVVLYFSDGVDGIMTCFDFAQTSLHAHATWTFTVTSIVVAVTMGIMQSIFYWGFDGGYIRREFGLSSKRLHKDSDTILDGLNHINKILDDMQDQGLNNLNRLDGKLIDLENILLEYSYHIKNFEQSLEKIDSFLERRKNNLIIRTMKYFGSGLGFLINAAAGFFCGKMLLGSLVLLGVSSPPGLIAFIFVCSLCALGRVLSYAFVERKKFGELFEGSMKKQKTFENKKKVMLTSFYKAKLAYLEAKSYSEVLEV